MGKCGEHIEKKEEKQKEITSLIPSHPTPPHPTPKRKKRGPS
jgi:hypothetical protein